jgi:hypothetical protein
LWLFNLQTYAAPKRMQNFTAKSFGFLSQQFVTTFTLSDTSHVCWTHPKPPSTLRSCCTLAGWYFSTWNIGPNLDRTRCLSLALMCTETKIQKKKASPSVDTVVSSQNG